MRNGRAAGFTLVELLVVMGLISVLVSLLVPVTLKVRGASRATKCMSNLRQMGNAWAMYVNESKGSLLSGVLWLPGFPEVAWQSYWPGVMDRMHVRGGALLCPSASDTLEDPTKYGRGNATHAWTGRFGPPGSVVMLTPTQYRDGSYGYNRYMNARSGQGHDGTATKVTSVKGMSEVPLFMDCTDLDVAPQNGDPLNRVSPPPDLHGTVRSLVQDPEHWKILIARHGRGINVCTSDGSVRHVTLDSLYMLKWRTGWTPYRLDLPGL